MKRVSSNVILGALAVILLLAGLALTYGNIRATPAWVRQLVAKAAILHELRARERTHASNLAAAIRLEEERAYQPVRLGSIFELSLPSARPDIRPLEGRELENGWSLRRSEVILQAVRLSELGGALQAAEDSRPPWRLVECAVSASDQGPGVGRVTLVMQALEKK